MCITICWLMDWSLARTRCEAGEVKEKGEGTGVEGGRNGCRWSYQPGILNGQEVKLWDRHNALMNFACMGPFGDFSFISLRKTARIQIKKKVLYSKYSMLTSICRKHYPTTTLIFFCIFLLTCVLRQFPSRGNVYNQEGYRYPLSETHYFGIKCFKKYINKVYYINISPFARVVSSFLLKNKCEINGWLSM